jgi:hypothetical protein
MICSMVSTSVTATSGSMMAICFWMGKANEVTSRVDRTATEPYSKRPEFSGKYMVASAG